MRLNVITKIQTKLNNMTSFSNIGVPVYINKLSAILEWAKEHPKFNTEFVENVLTNARQFQHISEKQKMSINNIISKYRINLDDYEKQIS